MAGEWYYRLMGEDRGPVSEAELRALRESGRISDDTWVKRGVDGAWILAGSIFGPAASGTIPAQDRQFDPYHRWLGIPPKHQPPNHYRLLAIEPFEDDPEVIRDAAERQMSHVRSYQLGKLSELSQRILNELAAARACLSDQRAKAEYDATLHRQLRLEQSAQAAALSPLRSFAPKPSGESERPRHPRTRGPQRTEQEDALTGSSRRGGPAGQTGQADGASEPRQARLAALLGNRVVLAGSAVALMLLVAVVAVLLFGPSTSEPTAVQEDSVPGVPAPAEKPQPVEPKPLSGLSERDDGDVQLVLLPAPGVIEAQQGDRVVLQFPVKNSDRFQGRLRYGLGAGAPAGAEIDPESGVFRWRLSKNQPPGGHVIKVTVTQTDMPTRRAEVSFAVMVTGPSRPAETGRTSDQNTEAGKEKTSQLADVPVGLDAAATKPPSPRNDPPKAPAVTPRSTPGVQAQPPRISQSEIEAQKERFAQLQDLYTRRAGLLSRWETANSKLQQLNTALTAANARLVTLTTQAQLVQQQALSLERQAGEIRQRLRFERDSIVRAGLEAELRQRNNDYNVCQQQYAALDGEARQVNVAKAGLVSQVRNVQAEGQQLLTQANALRQEWLQMTDAFGKLTRGNVKEAVATFSEWIRLEPSNPLPYVARGLAYLNAGERRLATADFKKATALEPGGTAKMIRELRAALGLGQ